MQQRLGRFEIIRRLGQGAMGEVYLGLDPAIGRQVALKTIHREAAQGTEARERFAREAQAAGTLNHPNLVTVHEFGEDQGVLFLAMEYVPGVDLEAMLRDRVLAPVEALEVLAQVCDGLAYAHQKGVVHRDIKPSNIRIRREGERLLVKVMDFGIARMAGSDMTNTDTLLGTFGYMAPEYIKTGVPEPASDLFAVGVMLYEALAGHRPFEGDTTASVLYRVVNEEPPPLAVEHLVGISPKCGLLLAKSLAKDPARRFHSAEDMARALRGAKDPQWAGPPGSKPTRPSQLSGESVARVRPPARIGPWVAALLVAVLGGAGTWAWFHRPEAPVISLQQGDGPPREAPPGGPPPKEAAGAEAGPRPVPDERPAPREESRPAQSRMGPINASEDAANELLNEAARGLVDQPQGSLERCDRVLRDNPRNSRAYALKVVALYGLGRYRDIPRVLDASREQGVRPGQLRAFSAFQAMLREERREPRLPADVRAALAEELAPGGPGTGQPPWNRRPQPPSRD